MGEVAVDVEQVRLFFYLSGWDMEVMSWVWVGYIMWNKYIGFGPGDYNRRVLGFSTGKLHLFHPFHFSLTQHFANQITQLLQNQTTLEFLADTDPYRFNQYDVGWRENVLGVMRGGWGSLITGCGGGGEGEVDGHEFKENGEKIV